MFHQFIVTENQLILTNQICIVVKLATQKSYHDNSSLDINKQKLNNFCFQSTRILPKFVLIRLLISEFFPFFFDHQHPPVRATTSQSQWDKIVKEDECPSSDESLNDGLIRPHQKMMD